MIVSSIPTVKLNKLIVDYAYNF